MPQCDLGQVAELVCTKGTVAVATPHHHRRELCEQRTRQLIETSGQNTQPSPRPVSAHLSDFCCSGQPPAPVSREPAPQDSGALPGELLHSRSCRAPCDLDLGPHLFPSFSSCPRKTDPPRVALPAPPRPPAPGPAGDRDRPVVLSRGGGKKNVLGFLFHSVIWTGRVSPPTDGRGGVDERQPPPRVLGE